MVLPCTSLQLSLIFGFPLPVYQLTTTALQYDKKKHNGLIPQTGLTGTPNSSLEHAQSLVQCAAVAEYSIIDIVFIIDAIM